MVISEVVTQEWVYKKVKYRNFLSAFSFIREFVVNFAKKSGILSMILYRSIFVLLLALVSVVTVSAKESPRKKKFPGGKCYIYRFALKDKHGSDYAIDRPHKFLSRESVERRKRQRLSIDSTDLPVNGIYIKLLKTKDTEIVGTSRWNNTVLVRTADTTVIAPLAEQPFVRSVKRVWTAPDSIVPLKIPPRVHDTFNPWDSVKASFYAQGKQQIGMHNGERLHAAGYKGKGMTIAVLDGGFLNVDRIPTFQQARILGEKDFVYPAVPSVYVLGEHGTKVLSTMAANCPGVFVGTAPEASFWLLRCEDTDTEQEVEEDYWAMAAEFADSVGADIINSSLGYSVYDNGCDSHERWQLDGQSTLISRTASMLADKGIVLVNSAGNDGMRAWKKLTFPADAYNSLTVGAVSPHRSVAPFSAVGPTQDGRVKPDVMAMGAEATALSARGTIIREMGTSFASPTLCGIVACLWQALPHMTAREIMELVRSVGDNRQHPDNVQGYGIPDMWRALMIGRFELQKNLNTVQQEQNQQIQSTPQL